MRITNKQIIRAIDNGDNDSGSYGSYFRINQRVGIKMIAFEYKSSVTRKALLKSSIYKDAVKEYKMIKEAHRRSKMVVATYGLQTFQYEDRWYVGILLEHISGPTLGDWASDDDVSEKVMVNLMKAMRKLKVYITDHNSSNFIKQRKVGWRIIDFSPVWVKVR